MIIRIVSGVIGLPLLIALVYFGGIPLKVACLGGSIIGMFEIYRAFSKKIKPVHYIGFIFAIFYWLFILEIINVNNYFNIFVSLFIVVLLIFSVVQHKSTNTYEIMETFFGFFYVCFLLSHIYLVREFEYGKFFVWLIFISAFGCDTGAYFAGITLGKHKLIPNLSPKKTVEGAIGGIAAATILSLIYGLIVNNCFEFVGVNAIRLCIMTGIVGSVLSQIGDLAASAIKRANGIKDYGNLIPGHGGILDRFDSVILTAPAVYYIMFFLVNETISYGQ